ncbi:MAG: hypothetical protein K9M75_07835 [Phycisphaerae bacterium]|nr:hypothetical protein [Phycisphaerae bacterium]
MKSDKKSEKEAVIKGNIQVRDFYVFLGKKLKRYKPHKYMTSIAGRLCECKKDLKKFGQTPPHYLLHSIEANCAFHKSFYDENLNWKKIGQIMNSYVNIFGDNAFLLHTIHENIDRFFLMMSRQQFELQNTASISSISRAWSLFVNNKHTTSLGFEFNKKFGISFEQWFQMAFLSYVLANNSTKFLFDKKKFFTCTFYDITNEMMDAFFKLTSVSIKQIKENYFDTRKEIDPAYHFLIRSLFLRKPIINLGNGEMISPNPDLILTNSSVNLHKLVSSIPGHHASISDSFESYVQNLLDCLNNKEKIVSSDELEMIAKKATGGKSCDYLIETDDSIILIECKATTFSARMFTDNAILKNNSTTKIAQALVQLYTTANDIYNGVFEDNGIDKNKPVIGIVVTLGEIPLVNSEWYFNNFILERANSKLKSPIFPSINMDRQPISMSIESFEKLITISNNTLTSILEIYDKKKNEGYAVHGDWNTYLKIKEGYELLPVVTENEKHFFRSMNVDIDKQKAII